MSQWKSILVDWSLLDEQTKVKIAAACVSGDFLDKLAIEESSNTVLCVQIAQNPNTMPITLDYMAKNCTMYVRELVAADERTTVETLTMLARDEAASVRSAVRKNPHTPEEVIKEIIGKMTK